MAEVLLDAFLDSLKIFPFLFLVYVLVEVIEEKSALAFKTNKFLKGRYAPLVGSSVGLIPQCGFSVMATNLFANKKITIGTLLAIYIATSDEAIPIILSNPSSLNLLFPLLLTKFILALLIGYSFDLFFYLKSNKKPKIVESLKKQTNLLLEKTNAQKQTTKSEVDVGCCNHNIESENQSNLTKFLWHPLLHSLKIFAYVLIINFIFGVCVYYIGQEAITTFLAKGVFLQPIVAALIGLIPNCASSVIITELYIIGGLTLGSTVAGLSVNAGIAIMVLFKQNKNIKENLFILIFLYSISVVAGMLLNLIF